MILAAAGRLGLVFALLLTIQVTRPVASPTQEMKFLGHLPLPPDWDGDQPTMLQVEAGKRVVGLYDSKVTTTAHLIEYDLSTPLPRIKRNADLKPGFVKPFPSPYINILDTKRNRLLMLVAKNFVGSNIDVVDLNTLQTVGSWNLFERIPGFVGWGLTYSAEDDLIYVVGEVIASASGLAQHGPLFPKPPVPSTLVALRPETGTLAWSVTLPHCVVLNTFAIGAVVARSRVQPAVYIPCARSSPYSNVAGLQRVWINPRASAEQALTFRQEFFPISGVWVSQLGLLQGVAAFDPATDRMVMQSLSASTPGAWIFDGRISGWVGFVATPEPYDAIGVNAGNGHYYAGAGARPVLVSPIRGTPVPQGTTYEHVRPGSVGTFIYTDAASNRVFVLEQLKAGTQKYAVYEDRSPDELPLLPTDFDRLTEDVAEGANTAATFAGGVRGFGSRVSLVGGTGAIWERVRQFVPFARLPGYPLSGTSPGDRTLTLGSVASLDLRNPGAAATAQAVSPDTNTDEDHRTRQRQIAEVCQMLEGRLIDAGNVAGADQLHAACERRPLGTPTPGQSPAPTPQDDELRKACASVQASLVSRGAPDVAQQLAKACETSGVNAALLTAAQSAAWPWTALGCLDGGEAKVEQQTSAPGGQGTAEITCNLDGAVSDATATAPGISLTVGGARVSIGSSKTHATAHRDPGVGIVTEITSEARNIEVAVPGSGSLSIGVARSIATATAHGRSGTADASLNRRLERVVLRDAQGKVLRSVNECDADAGGCRTVLDAAATLLAPRVRLYEPAFALRETPKGAFAGVQKAEAEYLNALNTQNDNSRAVPAIELLVYDDTAEKSRLVVQLAAAQVNAIYYITTVEEPAAEGPTTVVETVPVTVEVPGPPGPPQVVTRVVQRPGSPGAIENTFAVLARSPKEAVHLAAIWLLFGLAALALVRRRTLRRAVRPTD